MFQCPNCLRANHSDGLCNDCARAPKEEKMATVIVRDSMFHEGDWWARQEQDPFRATLRAHYDAAYLAALGGCSADSNSSNPQIDAHALALESVRTHAARMQELERLIEEVATDAK